MTAHYAAGLFPLDEPCFLQNSEMLDEPRQRHIERLGQLADRALAVPEPSEHGAPRGIGERAEDCVEPRRRIVNHKVKYERTFYGCQATANRRGRWRAESASYAFACVMIAVASADVAQARLAWAIQSASP